MHCRPIGKQKYPGIARVFLYCNNPPLLSCRKQVSVFLRKRCVQKTPSFFIGNRVPRKAPRLRAEMHRRWAQLNVFQENISFILPLMKLPIKDNQAEDQYERKYSRRKQPYFQIAARKSRNTSHRRRAYRGAKIPCQCQKSKHGSSAFRTRLGRKTDRTGPHNAHAEAAKGTPDQAEKRQRRKRGQQVASRAKHAA